ncbi:MAG TPA: methyltransferase domain-containing protein [Thermomicrobiales bacterium]|nr:methyltransferase domain-containing protein [Thermomicrobiales bacterium]
MASAAHTNPIAASLLETLDEPRFQEIRAIALDEMHLYPGAVSLEVGCGPGMLTEEILARTGPGSLAHGIDINPHFIRIATQRAEMLGLAGAEFVTGDCHTLPYDDEMFDAVVAERLLMHVAPITRVLSEISRVLTIGGRAVLIDYDPYCAFAAGPNPTITSRMLASAATMYATPLAARETPSACARVGLIVERVRGHLLVFEDATLHTAGGIASAWSEHAVAGRQVDRGTVQRWMLAVERAAAEGRFMIAIPHIMTVATRSY